MENKIMNGLKILAANPTNPIKLTLVSPDPANQQLAQVKLYQLKKFWNLKFFFHNLGLLTLFAYVDSSEM